METWRHESKVQRYGQIYEEVRALRKETRHSVQDLRERFKEKGVIQNKDQFIVKLIAQVGQSVVGSLSSIDWPGFRGGYCYDVYFEVCKLARGEVWVFFFRLEM